MKHEIDLTTWKRREHFEVFKDFDEPLFGFTVKVECSQAYKKAKQLGYSFSMYYLYLSLKAANETEEFRYRIEDDKVFCYDRIDAGPTIFRDDETFGFGYLEYNENIALFMKKADIEVNRVKAERGLKFPASGENLIHYSTLPWASFTSINHARRMETDRSIPKITFGKIIHDGDNMWMPMDIHANHALMDGFHAFKMIELFQKLLNLK